MPPAPKLVEETDGNHFVNPNAVIISPYQMEHQQVSVEEVTQDSAGELSLLICANISL